MTYPEAGTFARGGTAFPLASALTNSLLQDADPSLYQALAFFVGVLGTHIGPRLVPAAAAANVLASTGITISAAVMQAIPFDPRQQLRPEQFQFPLLAVWRETEKYEQRTASRRHSTGKWGVLYALPPMTPAQTEQMLPFLRAVGHVLDDRIRMGHDPAYAGDALVWSLAGLEAIELVSAAYGNFTGEGLSTNLYFPAWCGAIEVAEPARPVTGQYGLLAGVDSHEDIKAGDGTTVTDVVVMKSDVVVPGPG